jgi:predicted ATP-grasp superfamily ATP-dependent carboligase
VTSRKATGGSVLLVCDGETPHVLPAIRSLHAAGFRVGVALPQRSPRVGADSRHVAARHQVPRIQHGLPAFVEAVTTAIAAGRYDVILPTDDSELLALSSHRDALGARFPYPDHPTVVRAIDKHDLLALAGQNGVGIPLTCPATDAALAAVVPPVVVKARLHWSPDSTASDRHVDVVECATRGDVAAAVEAMRAIGAEPLLQQRVDGQLIALTVLLGRDSRLLAVAQQETQRLSPRRTSSRARTVAVDPDLLDRVLSFLTGLGWYGLANLQFLRDQEGIARLIDLNARFYGSLALAVRAGADFPALWVREALGLPVGGVVEARPGVRFQALEEDLRRARRERRGGLLRDAAAVAVAAPRSVHTTWVPTDPIPALRRVNAAAMVLLRRPGTSGQQRPDRGG